jgi:hypothetical protein
MPNQERQSSGKTSTAMNCTSTRRYTDIRFVDENAFDSIRRNNESDLIETGETGRTQNLNCPRNDNGRERTTGKWKRFNLPQ